MTPQIKEPKGKRFFEHDLSWKVVECCFSWFRRATCDVCKYFFWRIYPILGKRNILQVHNTIVPLLSP